QRLFSKVIRARENEVFEIKTITSQGNLVLASSTSATQLELNRYTTQGTISESIKVKKAVGNREKYDSYLVKFQNERMVLAAEKILTDEFLGIHLFDVDFASKQVKSYQS